MIYSSRQTRGVLYYNSETGKFWKAFANGKIKKYKANSTDGYILIRFNGRLELGHRIAWKLVYGVWPKDQVDHINRVKDDNRISNLREATNQENQRNKDSKGYYFYKQNADHGRKPWLAKIGHNKKTYYLGCFWTEEEARQAYLDARKRLGWD